MSKQDEPKKQTNNPPNTAQKEAERGEKRPLDEFSIAELNQLLFA